MATYQNKTYRLPFDGSQRITSPYGMRTLNGVRKLHKGLDIVAEGDKHIRAVVGGTVKSSTIITDKTNATWQWGNYVKVKGDDGLYWFYCHMASRAVKAGQRVEQGAVLGIMGSTGYSTGAHTHLEVRNASNTSLNTAEVLGIENAKQTLVQGAVETDAGTPADKPAGGTEAGAGGSGSDAGTPVTGSVPAPAAGEAGNAIPANPNDTADWDAAGNDFVVTASRGDRAHLRDACAQLQLPVKNA